MREAKVPRGLGINRYRVCEAREVENAGTEKYMSERLACVQGGKGRKNQTPGGGCGLRRGLGSILKLTSEVFSWDRLHILWRYSRSHGSVQPPSQLCF